MKYVEAMQSILSCSKACGFEGAIQMHWLDWIQKTPCNALNRLELECVLQGIGRSADAVLLLLCQVLHRESDWRQDQTASGQSNRVQEEGVGHDQKWLETS